MDEANQAFENFVWGYEKIISPIETRMESVASKQHLSFEQYLLLKSIRENPSITLSELAVESNTTRSATARKLRTLILNHCVEQVQRTDDRRVKYLTLTAIGDELEASLRKEYLAIMRDFSSVSGGPTVKQSHDFLQSLQKQLTTYRAQKKSLG